MSLPVDQDAIANWDRREVGRGNLDASRIGRARLKDRKVPGSAQKLKTSNQRDGSDRGGANRWRPILHARADGLDANEANQSNVVTGAGGFRIKRRFAKHV